MQFNGGLFEEGLFNDLCFEIQQYKKQLEINPNHKFDIVIDAENPYPLSSILIMNSQFSLERLNCGVIYPKIRESLPNKRVELISANGDKVPCKIQILLNNQ